MSSDGYLPDGVTQTMIDDYYDGDPACRCDGDSEEHDDPRCPFYEDE